MATKPVTRDIVKSGPAGQMQAIRTILESQSKNIQKALPKGLFAERAIQITMTNIALNPGIADCTPISVYKCVLQCSALGLMPDNVLGHAYLIPFKDNKTGTTICTFIPGYRGLINLAWRSGQVAMISADCVYEGDKFVMCKGLDQKLVHVPCGKKGKKIGVYAVGIMKNGGKMFKFLFPEDVDAIKARSRSARSGFSPWTTDEDAMWRKTALRQLMKEMPLSPEIQRIVEVDEAKDLGIEGAENADYIDVTAEGPVRDADSLPDTAPVNPDSEPEVTQ